MYIELHARSAFSFLEGSTLPEDLISVCAARGMSAMALLDRNGLYGSPRFYLAAQKAGMKAHIGAEISCEAFLPLKPCHPERSQGPAFSPHSATLSTNQSEIKNQKSLVLRGEFKLPLLVATRAGYQNLCQLITRMKLRAQRKEEGA